MISNSMFVSKENISQYKNFIQIDADTFFIPQIKSTIFGEIKTIPKFEDYAKFKNIKYFYTSLSVENRMGASTQVPATIEYICEQKVDFKFLHSKVTYCKDKNIFQLPDQIHYNLYYLLNNPKIYEHQPYFLWIFLYIKKNIIANKEHHSFRFRDSVFTIQLELLENMLSLKNLKIWKGLSKPDKRVFNLVDNQSKIAYYLFWINNKKVHKKFNDRGLFGYLENDFSQKEIIECIKDFNEKY